ncbi:hypothetical protein Pla123a_28760 [Posidoniimonas polymericola]|uniref:Uncharacterized protein n=1 Tax=Posidoniimonas polymericola TaxID=2528002 RepID=A0A5C5YMP6_9BACT|nr:hypothetical protein [Posidoniimonas polymericola]TWT76087.1 hypothetical protein Pla123a_28760 [Posidoniimonas polymericola]
MQIALFLADAAPTWLPIAGFALGAIGTVLGILNFWRNVVRDRPKLRVTPTQAIGVGNRAGVRFVGVHVVNMSTFPLTITGAGWIIPEVEAKKHRAHVIPDQPPVMGENIPATIGPREAASFVMRAKPETAEKGMTYTGVWAKTACGFEVRTKIKHLDSSFRVFVAGADQFQ